MSVYVTPIAGLMAGKIDRNVTLAIIEQKLEREKVCLRKPRTPGILNTPKAMVSHYATTERGVTAIVTENGRRENDHSITQTHWKNIWPNSMVCDYKTECPQTH
jgi:hypothetical protein